MDNKIYNKIITFLINEDKNNKNLFVNGVSILILFTTILLCIFSYILFHNIDNTENRIQFSIFSLLFIGIIFYLSLIYHYKKLNQYLISLKKKIIENIIIKTKESEIEYKENGFIPKGLIEKSLFFENINQHYYGKELLYGNYMNQVFMASIFHMNDNKTNKYEGIFINITLPKSIKNTVIITPLEYDKNILPDNLYEYEIERTSLKEFDKNFLLFSKNKNYNLYKNFDVEILNNLLNLINHKNTYLIILDNNIYIYKKLKLKEDIKYKLFTKLEQQSFIEEFIENILLPIKFIDDFSKDIKY